MKSKRFKLSLVFFFVLVIVFLFSGCTACAKRGWQEAYDAYTNEKYKDRYIYLNNNAIIEDFDKFINCKNEVFYVMIEEKDYPEIYGKYREQGYYFVAESIEILNDTGFYDDINENTVITFTVNNFIGWTGWCYPVFAVSIGEKTYLDFETGKENVLNYIQQRIEDPLGN